ncbi:MAG: septum formation protein Maf [Hirschia sp.]|nr:septum formation protein Maf [Hirschia sp.]MBF18889.1 septum formation protein Maf [Hirschia sp.]|tara:strand:+ start:901 stop:1506 length:606 start_codon:yes stop_codon:yes gene_type:complete
MNTFNTRLILASQSKSRGALMKNAGLVFEQIPANVDEDAVKDSLRAQGASTRAQAESLAELKAMKLSSRESGIVLGADQMLDLEGEPLDKPKGMAGARDHLQRMRGKTHILETSLVACENGQPIWRAHTRPRLTMRNFSDAFIDQYLESAGEGILSSVGAYHLEGLGAQLFSNIEGDYFSILGLPLIQLLTWLRDREMIAS